MQLTMRLGNVCDSVMVWYTRVVLCGDNCICMHVARMVLDVEKLYMNIDMMKS